MNYVIVGNSAAAIGAVEGIRTVDKKNVITIISDEPYHTYARPLISYYLAGKVSEEQMYYRAKDFYKNNNIDFLPGSQVVDVDTAKKSVKLASGKNIPYDKLLLATGGKPFVPPMEGLNKGKIFSFLKWDDVKQLQDEAVQGKKAVIIGAGLIGLKAAEALIYLGVKVTVVELADRILSSILDADAAAMVQRQLEDKGIKFELGTTVSQILGGDDADGVELKNGQRCDCNLLIVAIGVIPNTDAVRNTSLKIDRGIVIDDKMLTSNADIYAAGDVAQGYEILSGEKRVLPVLPNAYKQGETAGINMAGGSKVYPGGFAMNSIGFFGLNINTAGMTSNQGEELENLLIKDEDAKVYKKLILRNDRLVGYILINEIDRSGILTGLIRDAVPLSEYKERLLEEVGLLSLSDDLRHAKQSGGAA